MPGCSSGSAGDANLDTGFSRRSWSLGEPAAARSMARGVGSTANQQQDGCRQSAERFDLAPGFILGALSCYLRLRCLIKGSWLKAERAEPAPPLRTTYDFLSFAFALTRQAAQPHRIAPHRTALLRLQAAGRSPGAPDAPRAQQSIQVLLHLSGWPAAPAVPCTHPRPSISFWPAPSSGRRAAKLRNISFSRNAGDLLAAGQPANTPQ